MSKERLNPDQAFDEASKIKHAASEKAKERIKQELEISDTELRESYTDEEIGKETTSADFKVADEEFASAEKQQELEKKYANRFSKELWPVIDIDERILENQRVLNEFYEQRTDGEGKLMRDSFSETDTEMEKSLRDKERKLKDLKIELGRKLELFEFGHFGDKPNIYDDERINELRTKGINVGKVEYSYVEGAGESEDEYIAWPQDKQNVYRIVFLAKDKDKLPAELVRRLENDHEFRKYEPAKDHLESGNLDIEWEEKYPRVEESEVSPFPSEGRVLQAKLVKNKFGVPRVWVDRGYNLKKIKQQINTSKPINKKEIESEVLEEMELDRYESTLTSLVDVEGGIENLPPEFYLKVNDGKYIPATEEEFRQYEEDELKKEEILDQKVDSEWDKKLSEEGEVVDGEFISTETTDRLGNNIVRFAVRFKAPGKLKVRRKEKIEGGKRIITEEKLGLVPVETTNVFDNRPEGVKKEDYLGVYKFKPEYQRSGRHRGQIYFRQIDEEADSRPAETDPHQVELAKTAVVMEGLVSQHDDGVQFEKQMYAVREADGLYHAYVGEPGNLIPLKGFKSKATAETAEELIEIYKETGVY